MSARGILGKPLRLVIEGIIDGGAKLPWEGGKEARWACRDLAVGTDSESRLLEMERPRKEY